MFRIYPVLFIWLFSACSRQPSAAKHTSNDTLVIGILPLDQFPDRTISRISKELSEFYGVKTLILSRQAMFESARLSGTDRFSADKILTLLKGAMPRGCDRMLGLSSRDIFSPKTVKGQKIPYWGIFGLGYQPGNACVVSDFRLKKFNGKTEDLTVNVVLHECGHNFGLPHCSADSACLMNDAKGTIQTLFREKKWLCPSCRKKLNPLRT